MALVNREFGLVADENGFLVGIKKMTYDVSKIDENVDKILNILEDKINNNTRTINAISIKTNEAMGRNVQRLVDLNRNIERNTQGLQGLRKTRVFNRQDSQPVSRVQDSRASGGSENNTAARQNTTTLNNSQAARRYQHRTQNNRGGENASNNLTNTRQRDSNGRFISSENTQNHALQNNIIRAIKSGFFDAKADTQNIDPTIDALNEVKGILSPVGKVASFTLRPLSGLFKNKKRNEPLSRDEEKHNREQIRLLRRIADSNRHSGGFGGFFGRLLKPLMSIGSRLALAGGAVFGGLKILGKGGLGALAKVAKFGKGIPFVGTALSAMSLMNWKDKTIKEKGSSVGSIAGGVVGGALGTLLGPVGTMAGAAIGSWVGEKLGGIVAPHIKNWTDALVNADIPTRISNAWQTLVDGLKANFLEKIHNITEFGKEKINDLENGVGRFGDFTASLMDNALARFGNKDAQTRVAQRDRGEIGFKGIPYRADYQNTAPSVSEVVSDTGQALVTQPSSKDSFSAFIGKGEGGYNSVNLGEKHGYKAAKRNLTSMTIDEVVAMQKSREVNAVGKFQIIRDAMPEVVKGMGLTGKEMFNEDMQERMGAYLAFTKRKALGDFLTGKSDDITTAGNEAAREWASLPVFTDLVTKTKKKTYHAKAGSTAYTDGVNRASHSIADTDAMLRTARQNYLTAKKNGASESDAQLAAFRGMAAIQGSESKQAITTQAQPKTATPKNAQVPSATPLIFKQPQTATATPTAKTDIGSLWKNGKLPDFKSTMSMQQAKPITASYRASNIEIPQIENIKEPMTSPKPLMVQNVGNSTDSISQNLSDRGLAHLVTGGLGGNGHSRVMG